MSSAYVSPPDPGREWEKAEEVAMHFNDLLMRIRTFSLPLIATAVAAGSALGRVTENTNIEIPWLALALLLGAAGLLYAVFIAYLLFVWTEPNRRLRVNPLEYLWLSMIVLSLFSWLGLAAWKMWEMDSVVQQKELLFTAPVLALGGMVLFSIYLLDRFYYTSLLLGAVGRAEKIEHSLGRRVNLSHEISFTAQRWTYTVLPTVLYLLPLVILVNAAAAVAVG